MSPGLLLWAVHLKGESCGAFFLCVVCLVEIKIVAMLMRPYVCPRSVRRLSGEAHRPRWGVATSFVASTTIRSMAPPDTRMVLPIGATPTGLPRRG